MYESECAAFEKDVTAVTQYSDFNAPISISKTFWPSIKVQMSWCLVAWKVFSHGGLRDPRKEGRVKRGKLWLKEVHRTPVYMCRFWMCAFVCVCVFDSVCAREVKRNLAKTLNMNEEASVPHEPNVPAATWFNLRHKQTDACTKNKIKYTHKHTHTHTHTQAQTHTQCWECVRPTEL